MRDIFCPAEWQIMLNANDLISFGVIDRFNCTKLSQANAGNAPMCISTQDGGECKRVLHITNIWCNLCSLAFLTQFGINIWAFYV